MSNTQIKCCDFLLNQICFFPYEICPCCSKTIENTCLRPKIDFDNAKKFNLNDFFELREKYIEEFNDGRPFCFQGCTLYEPYNVDNASLINNASPPHYMVNHLTI